jgi:hypothetical protein
MLICLARPGADFVSDHNPVITVMKIRFRNHKRKMEKAHMWSVSKFHDEAVEQEFVETTEKEWENTEEDIDVEELCKMIKSGTESSANEIIGKRKTVARRPWMKVEILEKNGGKKMMQDK